jgi:hypothetical protein
VADESFVQVAADSTGKRIRNLSIQAVQEDGSIVTVQMQVVQIADENGNPISLTERIDLAQQLLDEARACRVGLQLLANWLHPFAGTGPGAQSPSNVCCRPLSGTVETNDLIEIAREMREDETT